MPHHSTIGYAKAANIFWGRALKEGNYPIFGVCLGFNIMATMSNNNGERKSYNVKTHLLICHNYLQSFYSGSLFRTRLNGI